jgi:methyl-accepting chemotaxis protein
MTRRLLAAALVIAAVFATGVAVYLQSATELRRVQQTSLEALMLVRRAALEEYLISLREEVRFWARNRIMRNALNEFSTAWDALEGDRTAQLRRLYVTDNPFPAGERDNLETAGDDSEYSRVHERYHFWLRSFLLHRGVYDTFLFNPEGDLVYTSFKEPDYATNLLTGKWRNTDLGNAFRAARDNQFPSYVAFFDFAPYAPSNDAPASFIAAPVLDDVGDFLGVLAFQLPADRIDAIMQVKAGMGETGETYIVGPDLLMRSDSRFSEQSTTLKTTVDTDTAHLALEGKRGYQVAVDYRGIPVLSAYGPLEFENTRWAILAEIDDEEAERPIERIRSQAILWGGGTGLFAAIAIVLLLRWIELY